jgi:hypothetical protein
VYCHDETAERSLLRGGLFLMKFIMWWSLPLFLWREWLDGDVGIKLEGECVTAEWRWWPMGTLPYCTCTLMDKRGMPCRMHVENKKCTQNFRWPILRDHQEYGRGDPLRWPHDTLYQLKLALTSPTGCGLSVGIVRLQTKTTESRYGSRREVKNLLPLP